MTCLARSARTDYRLSNAGTETQTQEAKCVRAGVLDLVYEVAPRVVSEGYSLYGEDTVDVCPR